ncbi:CoA transferase [Ochrobactrum sp. CM-21-5]|nr:CoA transferase [Ochrobactrum sp. CM-21-5]MBC2884718.1 CoA transferase [Ochrobactrum sp. CM-21-5]
MTISDDRTPCLNGIRVLDFTRVLAGPFCTALLGDLGAEIIKIESPEGDDYRHIGPGTTEGGGLFLLMNRNKKSLSVDLRKEQGRDIVRSLAKNADVIVENFRPGVMERLGLGYSELSRENPRLVHVAISGFGQQSPMGNLPAYDLVVQAVTGFMDISGEPDGPPMMTGESVADLTAGLFASWSVLAALFARERTGKGQFVDVAMYDCMFNLLPAALTQQLYGETSPTRVGNRHPLSAPFGVFAAADGYVTIAILSAKQFAGLAAILGDGSLASDERFATGSARNEHHVELKNIIEAWSRTLPVDEVIAILQGHDVPCSRVLSVSDAVASEQVRSRGLLPQIQSAGGPVNVLQQPVKFSAMECAAPKAPPALGADALEILSKELGLSAGEIETLARDGVLYGLKA